MRYKGQPIEKPKPTVIPIIREPEIGPEGQSIDKNIYFIASVVLDYSEFDKLCPPPEPPVINKAGEAPRPNFNDPEYQLQVAAHNQQRLDWLFLKSVEETKDLEWDSVNLTDPATWANFHEELRGAGITIVQSRDLLTRVYGLQSVDAEKVEQARRSFLVSQASLKQ